MKQKPNDWKDRLGVVFSTKPDFQYEKDKENGEETIPPSSQLLYVALDRKQRKGKVVTLVTGFRGRNEDLEDLGRELRKKCGTGGSAKDGEIIIQGDFKARVGGILLESGYKIKYK